MTLKGQDLNQQELPSQQSIPQILTCFTSAAIERTYNSELPIYHYSSFGFDKSPCLFKQDQSAEELRWKYIQTKSSRFEDELAIRTKAQIQKILANPREALKNPQSVTLDLQIVPSAAIMKTEVVKPQARAQPLHPTPLVPQKSTPITEDRVWLQNAFEFGHIPEDEPPLHVR